MHVCFPKVHGAYVSKIEHGRKIPLHPVDKVPEVIPGELLSRSTYLKRAHIVTLEVQTHLGWVLYHVKFNLLYLFHLSV